MEIDAGNQAAVVAGMIHVGNLRWITICYLRSAIHGNIEHLRKGAANRAVSLRRRKLLRFQQLDGSGSIQPVTPRSRVSAPRQVPLQVVAKGVHDEFFNPRKGSVFFASS